MHLPRKCEDRPKRSAHSLLDLSESFSRTKRTASSSRAGTSRSTEAKSIALSHAGKSGADAVFSKAMLDEDDGILVYELTFLADGQEYEYEISASTGDVIKYEQERSGQSWTHSNVSSKKLIEKERAKQIALSHAGIAEENISRYESELDQDDGKAKYEISFYAGKVEYDIEVNAVTGAVESFEMEED